MFQFESILADSTTSALSVVNAAICVGVALVLGVIIAFTHSKTSEKYTKNFLISLVIMPVLVQVVIMMVNGAIGTAIAVLGAFSLVKFRSLPGNAKEITSIFWAMATGLAVGSGQIVFAGAITVIVAIVLFVLYKVKWGDGNNLQKKLKIQIPEDLDYQDVFEDIFREYTKKIELRKAKTTGMGSLYELTYLLVLKDNMSEKNFIDELRVRNGNLAVMLSRDFDEKEKESL